MVIKAACRYHRAMPEAGSDEAFAAALAAIAAACEAARQEAAAAPDMLEAYNRASQLLEAISGERGQMARWRAKMAARIYRAQGLSLADLARKLGMSKSRADQFVRAAEDGEP